MAILVEFEVSFKNRLSLKGKARFEELDSVEQVVNLYMSRMDDQFLNIGLNNIFNTREVVALIFEEVSESVQNGTADDVYVSYWCG